MFDFNDAPILNTPAERPQVTDPIDAFRAAMEEKGYTPGEIIPGGQMQRFDLDKRGDKAGWYFLHLDGGCPAGAFGDWKSHNSHTWNSGGNGELDPARRAAFARQIERAKEQREAEKAQA